MRLQAVESIPPKRQAIPKGTPSELRISEPQYGQFAINGERMPKGTTMKETIRIAWDRRMEIPAYIRPCIHFDWSFDAKVKLAELRQRFR